MTFLRGGLVIFANDSDGRIVRYYPSLKVDNRLVAAHLSQYNDTGLKSIISTIVFPDISIRVSLVMINVAMPSEHNVLLASQPLDSH